MKKLLVLGAGLLQLSTIRKAKDFGYYTIAVDGNPNAEGLFEADKGIVANIVDDDVILKIAVEERIDGIIHPCSEVAMLPMAKVVETLNLSGIGVETTIKATNKEKMRRAFEIAGAPSPMSIGVTTEDEAIRAFKAIGGNVIVKPSRSSGSRGVTYIDRHSTGQELFGALKRAVTESRDASAVIEHFVEGPEFSVEMLIWGNNIKVLTVTDKLTTGYPYFVELGHSQPSRYTKEEVTQISAAAIKGVRALGLKQCVAHAELKLTKEGPYLMEIGARLGGDFISTELVRLSTGIDMVGCAISIALGLEPDLTLVSSPGGAAIRYFIPKSGVIKLITGLENVKKSVNLHDFKLYVKEGDFVRPLLSSLDRCGHVITIGHTAEEAITVAEEILNEVVIITN